jgi:hypothetical protein
LYRVATWFLDDLNEENFVYKSSCSQKVALLQKNNA